MHAVLCKRSRKKLFSQKSFKNKFYIIDLTDANCPSLQKLSLMSESDLDKCPNQWYKCLKFEVIWGLWSSVGFFYCLRCFYGFMGFHAIYGVSWVL